MHNITALKRNTACIILIGLAVLLNNYWVITLNNGFLMDDYSWLWMVKFNTVKDIFNFLPIQIYNDRPVGAIFIKIMFSLFGDQPAYYHAVQLCLHIFNSLLLFFIVKKISVVFWEGKGETLAVLSAIIFGMWPNSTMAVQWIAAIFDLLGGTFYLLVINLFVDILNENERRYKVFNMILCTVFYYLALRTKEMVIVLPAILLFYETGLQMKSAPKNKYKKRVAFRPSFFSLGLCCIMILYFGYIMKLKSGMPEVTAELNSPYYYSFNPLVLGSSFLRYISVHFNFWNPNFVFTKYSLISGIILFLFSCTVIFAVFSSFKKKFTILSLLICFSISIAPVLPMANMQNRLYLYIPSIFISVLLAYAVNRTICFGLKKKFQLYILSFFLIPILYLSTFSPGVTTLRNYWAALCLKDRNSISDIMTMPNPGDSSIYVKNAESGYNVFFYGPGFINRIIFNSKELTTYLNINNITDKKTSYYVMEYNNMDGHITYQGRMSFNRLVLSTNNKKITSQVP